jgi:hypothetical protein
MKGEFIKCDSCGEIKDVDVCRKVVVFEKVRMRFKGDDNYVGNTKLKICETCLKKIGYNKK